LLAWAGFVLVVEKHGVQKFNAALVQNLNKKVQINPNGLKIKKGIYEEKSSYM